MLLYHPMFDLYHCIARLMTLVYKLGDEPYPYQKIQILDYYLLFPCEIKKMKPFPREFSLYRSFIKDIEEPYSILQDSTNLIHQLQPILLNGLKILASYNLIEIEELKLGLIKKKKDKFTSSILNVLADLKSFDNDVLDFITEQLGTMDFFGDNGLKQKSKLLEYRYDYE